MRSADPKRELFVNNAKNSQFGRIFGYIIIKCVLRTANRKGIGN